MTVDSDSQRQGPPIRVLIADLSEVVFGVVMRALQQHGITAKQHVTGLSELALAVGDQTDVLIIGAPYVYPPPTICRELWDAFPALKVLVLTPSGDAAMVYWLSVRRHRLKTVSAQTLVSNIRRVHHLDLTGD